MSGTCKLGGAVCLEPLECVAACIRANGRLGLKIGDKVPPAPKPRLDVRPMSFVDDPKRGPRGVFTNGSRGK